jgi:hypothetical protein
VETDEYFDEGMRNRQRLFWALATRRQLERWEPYVARWVLEGFSQRQLPSAEIWAAQLEHHFTLISARHLVEALQLPPPSVIAIDETMRAEIIEGRDLLEHWRENLPIFNVRPRREEPRYRSGREFANRHPDRGPYNWLGWSGREGAVLMPNVPAPALHDLVDAVESEVVASDPELQRFVPARAPSPWIRDEAGLWWPRP